MIRNYVKKITEKNNYAKIKMQTEIIKFSTHM